MDIVGNQAILTPAEVLQSGIGSPYDITGECIEKFREAEREHDLAHHRMVGLPGNRERAALKNEQASAMLRMNLFRRMTVHYLESPLDQV